MTSLRLYFELQNVDTNDLNYKITQLNIMLNKFYAENIKVESERAGSLLNKIPKDKIDSLESILYTKFANYNHPYFRDYLQYAIAEIKLISRSYDKLEIFNQYLWSHRPIYDNVQFMSFFINYFKDFIINSNKIKNRDLISNIEWKVNYTALLDSLGKDTLLRNEVTRELVLLQNIVDWANMKLFTIDSLKKLLDQFYINTKFDHHRLIIRNIQRNMFTINRVDLSEIPLLSKNNDTIFLKQFNTDFILLYFFTSWCRPCIKELVTLDAIAPDICNKIKIIAISADRIPINFYYFTQDYSLQNIDLYYFNQHYELLENLKIVVYPQSILLNKEGYIINAAMPDIKNGLIEYLYNIF